MSKYYYIFFLHVCHCSVNDAHTCLGDVKIRGTNPKFSLVLLCLPSKRTLCLHLCPLTFLTSKDICIPAFDDYKFAEHHWSLRKWK